MDRRLNKPKVWQEVEFIGRQSIVRKHKPREWVTIYQKSGVSLQINPTYYELRLWVFSKFGNVAIDLNRDKISQICKGLGIARFLISNVPSHGVTWRSPSQLRPTVKLTKGERIYLSRKIGEHFFGKGKRINDNGHA